MDIIKAFTLFNRKPTGLAAIMRELKKRQLLTTKEDILSGKFYQNEVTQSMGSWLYSKTIGAMWGQT